MKKKIGFLIGCLSCLSLSLQAQQRDDKDVPEKWNIKSNLLYDATGTVNLGVEMPLADQWSLDLSGNYIGWNWKYYMKWKHWMVQPELRWWTRRTSKGHFLALHALGGEYNMGNVHFPFGLFKPLRTERHDGWYAGAGIGYGYRWNFSSRWGMEAEAALGYVRFDYSTYEWPAYGDRLKGGTRNYFGPTKLAVNLVYRFGKRKTRRTAVDAASPTDVSYLPDTVRILQRDTVIIREDAKESVPVLTRSEPLYLRYKQGDAEIHPTFNSNPTELARVTAMIDDVKAGGVSRIRRIVILGYASPEGGEAFNQELSLKRATGVRDYLASRYPELADKLTAVPGGEDWRGLQEAVQKDPSVPARTEVLSVVNQALSGDAIEAKAALKALAGGEAYRYLIDNIYPGLRQAECRIEYTRQK